jgi:hypothetical protein
MCLCVYVREGGGGSIFLMFSSEERIYQAVNVDNHFSINTSKLLHCQLITHWQ